MFTWVPSVYARTPFEIFESELPRLEPAQIPDWTDGRGTWFWKVTFRIPEEVFTILSARKADEQGYLWWADIWEDVRVSDRALVRGYDRYPFSVKSDVPLSPEQLYGSLGTFQGLQQLFETVPRLPSWGRRFLRPDTYVDPFTGRLVWMTSRSDLWGGIAKRAGIRVVRSRRR